MALTPYLRLNKPPFDTIPWDEAINGDMDILDGFIAQYMHLPNFQGAWANTTAYVTGQVLLDPTNATMWHCNVSHTSSAAPVTFASERAAFPSYWTNVSTTTTGYLPLAGGTMLGPLVLSGTATNPQDAASKAYVDAHIIAVGGGVASFNTRVGTVVLTSGDVTGALTYTPYNVTNPAGYQTAAQVSSSITANLGSYYTAGTSDARYVYKTGDTVSGALVVASTLSAYASIVGVGGRLVIQGSGNNPSLCMWNISAGYAGGFYMGAAGAIQFGGMDGNGGVNAQHGYLAATSLGFYSAGPVSIAVSGGSGALCFGTASSFTVPSVAWKPGGGSWSDSSDARIKTVVGDYMSGLAAILALRPVRYTFNNNWHRNDGMQSPHGNTTGQEYIGLVAQEAEVSMPEMVSQIEAVIDDVPVTDLRTLDMSALPLAIVNAIKELAQRVTVLEGALAGRVSSSSQ